MYMCYMKYITTYKNKYVCGAQEHTSASIVARRCWCQNACVLSSQHANGLAVHKIR